MTLGYWIYLTLNTVTSELRDWQCDIQMAYSSGRKIYESLPLDKLYNMDGVTLENTMLITCSISADSRHKLKRALVTL